MDLTRELGWLAVDLPNATKIGGDDDRNRLLDRGAQVFVVPAALYVASRQAEFSEAVFVLMVTFIACFLLYIAFPVAGPRYSWATTSVAPRGPIRTFVTWLL